MWGLGTSELDCDINVPPYEARRTAWPDRNWKSTSHALSYEFVTLLMIFRPSLPCLPFLHPSHYVCSERACYRVIRCTNFNPLPFHRIRKEFEFRRHKTVMKPNAKRVFQQSTLCDYLESVRLSGSQVALVSTNDRRSVGNPNARYSIWLPWS